MPFTFKVGESIKKSWGLYKENLGNIILLAVVSFILNMIINRITLAGGFNPSVLRVISTNLMMLVFGVLAMYIWVKSILNMIDGKGFRPFSKETFSEFSKFWNFVKTNILIVVCMVPVFSISFLMIFLVPILGKGLMFGILGILVLAYIYIMTRLYPALYISIDKNFGARRSFALAWSITDGYFWNIIWKNILIVLFMMLGILALLIGTIVTYPIGMFVITMLYRWLLNNKNPVEIPKEEVKEAVGQEEKIIENVEIKEEVKEEVKPETV